MPKRGYIGSIMKRHLFLLSALLILLAACQTAAPPPIVYNDILLSSDDGDTVLPGTDILSVKLQYDDMVPNGVKIAILLTKEGSATFADITKRNLGKLLAMTVSQRPILSATIMAPILDGRIVVTGSSREDAAAIVDALVKK